MALDEAPQQQQTGSPVSTTESTNALMLNQVMGKVLDTLGSNSSAVVAKLMSIASHIASDLIGGTTGTTANRILTAKGTTGRALQASGASVDASGNINTNGGDLTVDDITGDSGAFASLTVDGVDVATVTQAVGASYVFKSPEDETVPLYLNFQFGWTITKVTTITEAGTSTVTVKIGTTALGGSANSASTSEQTQTHSSANVVAVSDKLQVTFASTSSDCENLCVTIQGTRTLQSGT